jgi:hypothetical protein
MGRSGSMTWPSLGVTKVNSCALVDTADLVQATSKNESNSDTLLEAASQNDTTKAGLAGTPPTFLDRTHECVFCIRGLLVRRSDDCSGSSWVSLYLGWVVSDSQKAIFPVNQSHHTHELLTRTKNK